MEEKKDKLALSFSGIGSILDAIVQLNGIGAKA